MFEDDDPFWTKSSFARSLIDKKSFNEGLKEFEELAKQGNWVKSNSRFLASLLGDLKSEKLNARASQSVSDILRLVEDIGALAPDDDANIFHGYGLSADEAFAHARLLLHMGHPSAALEIIETLSNQDDWLTKNYGELEVIVAELFAELKEREFDNGEDLVRLEIFHDRLKRARSPREVGASPLPPIPAERPEGTSTAKVKREIDDFVLHGKIARSKEDGALFDDLLKEITKEDFQLHDLSETLRKDGRVTAPQLEDRYANFAFMQSGTVLDAGRAIAPETDCELRFNIGPLTSDRIPEKTPDGLQPDPKPFPLYALPPASEGHWLDVVIASGDFEVKKGKYRVFLPLSGSSWVCDCNPRNRHTCTSETRRDYLFVPVKTPKARNAEVRVGVYFKNNLLQSYLLTVAVATTQDGAQPQSVLVDYTIHGSFSDFGRLGQKTINILASELKSGEIGFVINGDFENSVTFQLTEGKLSTAIDAARYRLREIHLERGVFGGIVNRLDANNGKSRADFIEDLRNIAPLGVLLRTVLFQSQPDLWHLLGNDILREPSTIQIARASTNFVFPWNLIYDIHLDATGKEKYRPCKVVDEWKDGQGLSIEGMYSCPHEVDHKPNTLCPFGFWGMRHIIEQPPSVGRHGTLASEIRISKPPASLIACISNDLEAEYTEKHLESIDKLKFRVEKVRSKTELLSRLTTVDAGVVYLYCHGGHMKVSGTEAAVPFLAVGTSEKLTPMDVLPLSDLPGYLYWTVANPLVFINGCHTLELTPDVLVNFVDAFAGLNSSGVIGTEVTVHQALANEVGTLFLESFLTKPAGEAIRDVRHRLVRKGNLMGLAYTAYCLSSLRLADALASRQNESVQQRQ